MCSTIYHVCIRRDTHTQQNMHCIHHACIFPITYAYLRAPGLGIHDKTRQGLDEAMFQRRELIIATVGKPANSKAFRLSAGSQKPRATQAQAKTQVVRLPTGAPAAAGAAASQKQGSQVLAHQGWYMILQPLDTHTH